VAAKYGKKDMALDELDFNFIASFEKFLKVKEDIDHNAAMSYIKRLKRIITIAVNNR
jgi:integrase